MHKKTHRARYFSKMLSFTFFSTKVVSSKKCDYFCCLCLATHVEQVDAWQHSLSGIPYGHFRSFVMFFVTSLVV
jgi:hypothetical protein